MRHHSFGFECASCGTIRLDIPKDAQEFTLIRCANCSAILGEWGKIQDMFIAELRDGAFDLNDGQITAIPWQPRPRETKLEMAVRHVREAAAHVSRQRELVRHLGRAGYATDNAMRLLITFEELQHMHEAHLEKMIFQTKGKL